MKVTIDGKEFFNVDTNDIPENINITKDTLWTDKWAMKQNEKSKSNM